MNIHIVLIMGKLEYKGTGIISSFNGLELVELTNDIHYVFKYNNRNEMFTITVPKGFVTDFGTVPKWAQCIINPQGKGTLAYILHDWLCITNMYPRKKADKILFETLDYCGVDYNRRLITYVAVRFYAVIIDRLLDDHIVSAMDTLNNVLKTKKTD